MNKVIIIKNWQEPDLFRQTPKYLGIWDDIHFTSEVGKESDYVIVLNYSPQEISLLVSQENIWCLYQEPPNEYYKFKHRATDIYTRVFTQDASLKEKRYVLSQPALPWHVDRDYDTLTHSVIPLKKRLLSFITSNKTNFGGHRVRLDFLNKITGKIDFDLFGYGFNPIADKWDALAPYRYSLAIENYSGPFYWSEKLADCFLSWTMPIYYGCTNITDYFPKESLIQIDVGHKDVTEYVREIIQSDLWIKRREAISYARELVLKKYQFFPFMVEKIKKWEKERKGKQKNKEIITIPKEDTLLNLLKLRVKMTINSLL